MPLIFNELSAEHLDLERKSAVTLDVLSESYAHAKVPEVKISKLHDNFRERSKCHVIF